MADDTQIEYVIHRLDGVDEKVSTNNSMLSALSAKLEALVENFHEQREENKRNTDILQENTASLQDHMKRSDDLEEYIKKVDARFTPIELEILRKNAVADWWKSRVFFLAKLGGAITALGALGAMLKFILQSL